MKYNHIATNEWLTPKDIQERLDNKFDFKCNECKKSIDEHLAVLSEGIFCKPCQLSIIKDIRQFTAEADA